MPAHQRSLAITDRYREAMLATRRRVQSAAQTAWGRLSPDDLDGSYPAWLASVDASVRRAQREAVRSSNAYLIAFVTSELAHAVPTPSVDASGYVGRSWDGQALEEALRSPLIAVKVAIKDGKSVEQALRIGRDKAVRGVGLDTDWAFRQSLTDAMKDDPRIAGYHRAVRGTCDFCLGVIAEGNDAAAPGTPLEIHPGCACVAEPSVKNVPNHFPRPSGTQIFAGMSVEEQDSTFGVEKAKLLRDGTIALADCVGHSTLATAPDFGTSKPLSEIPAAQTALADTGGPNGSQ